MGGAVGIVGGRKLLDRRLVVRLWSGIAIFAVFLCFPIAGAHAGGKTETPGTIKLEKQKLMPGATSPNPIPYRNVVSPRNVSDEVRSLIRGSLVYAHLSEAVYGSTEIFSFKRVDDSERKQYQSGIHATLYCLGCSDESSSSEESSSPRYVLAFEGTKEISWSLMRDPGEWAEFLKDWANNAQQVWGTSPQEIDALDYVNDLLKSRRDLADNLVVTGHSLGGNLAQVVASNIGVPAVTFNSQDVGWLPAADFTNKSNIINFKTVGSLDETALNAVNLANFTLGRDIYMDGGTETFGHEIRDVIEVMSEY